MARAAQTSNRLPRRALQRAHSDQRGEVFPVAILFGGVLLTILIGLHVVLLSLGRTAVQSAADRAVSVAQAAPIGASACGTLSFGGSSVTPSTARECEATVSAIVALRASGSMVRATELPIVNVDEASGVVAVAARGAVMSPVFGHINVVGYACGPLDLVASGTPSRADPSAC